MPILRAHVGKKKSKHSIGWLAGWLTLIKLQPFLSTNDENERRSRRVFISWIVRLVAFYGFVSILEQQQLFWRIWRTGMNQRSRHSRFLARSRSSILGFLVSNHPWLVCRAWLWRENTKPNSTWRIPLGMADWIRGTEGSGVVFVMWLVTSKSRSWNTSHRLCCVPSIKTPSVSSFRSDRERYLRLKQTN